MAMRHTWKGFLKISLVSVPIRVYPAHSDADTVSFNMLHKECHTRIQQKRWCPKCNRELAMTDIVKGYEFDKNRYVVIDADDLAKVKPASTRIVDLVQFTDIDAIDPIYYDRPYFLAPDGPAAASAYGVIRDGMAGKAGIGRMAMYGREYLVAVMVRDNGLLMYTMRQASQMRSMADVDGLAQVPATASPAEAELARQVIATFERPLNLRDFTDQYQAELRRLIDAKINGQTVVEPSDAQPERVVSLMDALKRSLDTATAAKQPPVKSATLPKTADKTKRTRKAS